MSKLIPFITVEGALDAIEFYKDVFDAKLLGEITWLENVPGMDKPEFKGLVGHSTLQIQDSVIFIHDELKEFPLASGDRIQMVLDLDTEDRLRTAFDKLKAEGKVVQELHEVFWGALFGSVKDKFGITWQLYYGHK